MWPCLRVENWRAGSKYEKVIWRCGHKYAGETKCSTGHIDDAWLTEMFLEAVRLRFAATPDDVVGQALLKVLNASDLELEAAQIEEVAKKLETLIACKARVAQDQDAYETAFSATHQHHQALLEKHAEVLAKVQPKYNLLAAYHYYQQEIESLDIDHLSFSP